MNWFLLIITLPTENSTVRMRAWRTLKASGTAILRDGVYLLPDRSSCRSTFNAVAADVQSADGSAYLMAVDSLDGIEFPALFSRDADYAALLADIDKMRNRLSIIADIPDVIKQIRKLRKHFGTIAEIDFFPGEAQRQADTALQELELTIARALSPDEPHAVEGTIPPLNANDYQARTWATRHRPWVDRLGCAWLIRRFIDPQARFLWLDSPADCPNDALGFDFDGATFSHVGSRVTFEVLLVSFNLEQSALKRIGALVHFLDVGGIQPPESSGVESVLAGLRDAISDDDKLLIAASTIFDGLLTTFNKKEDL
jgi:hypothetical protein